MFLRQLSDLGMQALQIDARGGRLGFAVAEDASRAFEKLALPLRDLVGVNIEKLGQFAQRLLAPEGGKRHLRLESRSVRPAGSFRHMCS